MNASTDNQIRGFSYMLQTKIEVEKLMYIEGEELDRTWKTSKRERQKLKENQIWNEFCAEQDVVSNIFEDDPYQFLEQLPECYMKEFDRLEKLAEATKKSAENNTIMKGGAGDQNSLVDKGGKQQVAFTRGLGKDIKDGTNLDETYQVQSCDASYSVNHCESNNVEQDCDEDGKSYTADETALYEALEREEDPFDESLSNPPTVRENTQRSVKEVEEKPDVAPDKTENKKSESISKEFESSIYRARVREIRLKMNEMLQAILVLFQTQNVDHGDPAEMLKLQKRANEFSGRFARIYMYQLQRQLHDLKRSMTLALPFAKRTQFQSQMLKIVSLHQNTLQAIQVFHRSLEKTLCLDDSGQHFQALLLFLKESSDTCMQVGPPGDLKPVQALYDDEVLLTCNKIEEFLLNFNRKNVRSSDQADNESSTKSTGSRQLPYGKKLTPMRVHRFGKKKSPIKAPQEQLSMYSLDTLRLNLNPKTSDSKENNSSTSSKKSKKQTLASLAQRGYSVPKRVLKKKTPNQKKKGADDEKIQSHRTPRSSRRPFMRDPQKGKATIKKHTKYDEVQTMVESVADNSPTRLSLDPSPTLSPQGLCTDKGKSTSSHFTQNSAERTPLPSPDQRKHGEKALGGSGAGGGGGAGGCDVTRLLHRLCGGPPADRAHSAARAERVSGAKNAQLVCVSSSSSRPPSTPQLLKILEENIQKQPPSLREQAAYSPKPVQDSVPPEATSKADKKKLLDKLLLNFNIPEQTAENVSSYRTQFVQYMISSPMYANSAISKPWEMIGRVSDRIIDELLLGCTEEMKLQKVLQDMCRMELK